MGTILFSERLGKIWYIGQKHRPSQKSGFNIYMYVFICLYAICSVQYRLSHVCIVQCLVLIFSSVFVLGKYCKTSATVKDNSMLWYVIDKHEIIFNKLNYREYREPSVVPNMLVR